DTISVSVNNLLTGTVVRYTLDGTTPTTSSPALTSSLVLSNTTTVKVLAFFNVSPVSAVVSATYTKAVLYSANDGIPDSWRLQYFGAGYQTDPRVVGDADPDGDGLTNYQEY